MREGGGEDVDDDGIFYDNILLNWCFCYSRYGYGLDWNFFYNVETWLKFFKL